MKATRLLTSVLCFLLVINFFRTINNAGFLGASDVLERLDKFEIDLTPVHNLVELWQENDYGNIGDDLVLTSSDAGIMTVPGVAGSGSFGQGGFYDPGEDATWIEEAIAAIGEILENGWNTLSNLFDSVLNLGSLSAAISSKISLIFNTIKYLFTNGLSLLMLPIHLLSQTLSFSFWILGFGN